MIVQYPVHHVSRLVSRLYDECGGKLFAPRGVGAVDPLEDRVDLHDRGWGIADGHACRADVRNHDASRPKGWP
jgi:hypothetical protein